MDGDIYLSLRESMSGLKRWKGTSLEPGMSGPGPSRDGDGNEKAVDGLMVDREQRNERSTGPSDRELSKGARGNANSWSASRNR